MRIAKLALTTIGLLASAAAYAGTPGWSLSETSGQVTVASTGLVKAATRGGSVVAGDIVSTGRNGRAVLVRGEEYLIVAPNSRIRVADPAKSGGFTQIIENFGNVVYKIKKMTMPHFAVETPFLAAVVKGTTFSVTVTDKGASVQVIEGRVEVATRDGGASFMVLPGDIGSVSASAPAALNVQGRETKTIVSPTPAAAAAAVTASITSVEDRAVDRPQSAAVATIDAAVSEGRVDLGAVSDGMVKGDSSQLVMAALATETSRDAVTPTPVVAPAATPTPAAIGEPVTGGPVISGPATAGPALVEPPSVEPASLPPQPPVVVTDSLPNPQPVVLEVEPPAAQPGIEPIFTVSVPPEPAVTPLPADEPVVSLPPVVEPPIVAAPPELIDPPIVLGDGKPDPAPGGPSLLPIVSPLPAETFPPAVTNGVSGSGSGIDHVAPSLPVIVCVVAC